MTPEKTLNENLIHLQNHLDRECGNRDSLFVGDSAAKRKFTSLIPLAHGRNSNSFQMICRDGHIKCLHTLCKEGQRDESACRQTIEAKLGTWDFVFFYTSNFCYPNTECGFLFEADLEVVNAKDNRATPFDSGGLIGYLMRDNTLKEQRDLLQRSELPCPQYRDLFGSFLFKCFDHPDDYFAGMEPHFKLFKFQSGDRRQWTFEVRTKESVEIGKNLLAVFLPSTLLLSDAMVKKMVIAWRRQGVVIKAMASPNKGRFDILQREGERFLKDYLKKSFKAAI